MKNRFIIMLLLSLAFGLSASAQQWKLQDFKALAAVKGFWLAKNTGGGLVEVWTIKNDSLIEGKSFYIKEKKEELAETVQLGYARGRIQYIVTAYGQNDDEPVAFDLVTKKNKTFTFENKEHDFPQQIVYRFLSTKNIQVTILGKTAKGPKKIDFNFVKMNRRKFE